MAKQNGILPIRGTKGNMVFVQTKKWLYVRKHESQTDRN